MLQREKDILLEDVTSGFPVEGAPAHRNLSVSEDKQHPAASAHFSERGCDEKDIALCMAALGARELRN